MSSQIIKALTLEMTEPTLQQYLDEVSSQYEIEKLQLQFGTHSFEFVRPADPECVLDDETLVSGYENLQWQPYWAQAWDSSLGTAHYFANQKLEGTSVLDLGCGLGLTSAVLLAAGATLVCGDNAPPSLPFARINTWPWRDRATVQLIDWNESELDQQFDIIVGSDILYEHTTVKPLDSFFRIHLKKGGRVLLIDPSRPMTCDFLKGFDKLGWLQHIESFKIDEVKQPIRVVTLTLE